MSQEFQAPTAPISSPSSSPVVSSNASSPDASRFLPILLILFAGSGCAALIYEIVWYQMLQLAIGSTAVSMGFLLAAFMSGLCLGSIGWPRLSRYAHVHPLRVYAALEAGIGVLGILVLFGVPYIDRAYIIGFQSGLSNEVLRGLLATICLLPPTFLMGASLPALSRWLEMDQRGVSWWGLLYGGNTLGAVFGCLLAGFYLLRLYNMATATYVAAAINFAVAALSFLMASRLPARSSSGASESAESAPSTPASFEPATQYRWTIYLTIALSGAGALGAEVVWTRLMGMLLGSTVYVFSIILAVFLVGLAVGSGAGAALSRSVQPRAALGWCQVLLAFSIAWTAYMIADSLPYWPINPMLTTSPWHTFQLDMARCLWAILPPTLFWGASFPLALAAAARPGEDSGKLVGGIYAANTLGAIVGALAVSLVLVPWIGTQDSQRVILLIAALSAAVVLGAYAWERSSHVTAALLTLALLFSGYLAVNVDAIPGELIAYGRRMAISGSSKVLYTVEGRNSSVAITQYGDGAIEVDVNGHVEATTEIFDMKLQRMVGHLPALLHPNPKSILGIGFGAGVSAGTFTRYPGIEHITVCEIEPVIPPTSTRFFAKQDYDVYHNPKTHIVYDDARHYILTTKNTYDVIASDPLDVFVKGTAAIYSKEYFEMVKAHLNPGGFFSLYVPLYETDERTIKSEIATFLAAFPYGTIWANTRNGLGYDMVFLGQLEPLKIDLDEVQARLARPDYAPVAQSLSDVGINSIYDLFGTYAGGKTDLGPWIKGAEINSDADLRLQYLGGWGINSQLEDYLYLQIMHYRRIPRDLFTGSPAALQAVQLALYEAPGASR
jgi:spermidine synthase